MRLWLAVLVLSTGCNLHQFFDDPRCYTSADCTGGKVCSAFLCIGVGSLGTTRTCWASRDCQPGQTCAVVADADADPDGSLAQRCVPAGTSVVGARCTRMMDCAQGLWCDTTCTEGGTVDYEGACATTADCLAGLTCGASLTCLPYAP